MPAPRVIIVAVVGGVGRARVVVEHIRLLVTLSILSMLVVRFLISLALCRVIAGITVTGVATGASGVGATRGAHLARLRIAVPLGFFARVVAMVRGRLLLGFDLSLVDFSLLLLLLFEFLCEAELFGERRSFLMTLIQDHLLLQIFLAIDILLLKVRLVEVEEVIAQLYESKKTLSGVMREYFFSGGLPSRTLS